MSSLLNTTLCQMKLNKWKELVLVANRILDFDENNSKAIYRKALGLKELQDYEKSFECIHEFLKKNGESIDSESKKELVALNSTIEKLLTSYKNKEKKMFTQMFKVSDN